MSIKTGFNSCFIFSTNVPSADASCLFIEYFFIKRHPSNIRWQSTISQTVTIYEKYEQAIKKLNELDRIINKQHTQIAGTSLES